MESPFTSRDVVHVASSLLSIRRAAAGEGRSPPPQSPPGPSPPKKDRSEGLGAQCETFRFREIVNLLKAMTTAKRHSALTLAVDSRGLALYTQINGAAGMIVTELKTPYFSSFTFHANQTLVLKLNAIVDQFDTLIKLKMDKLVIEVTSTELSLACVKFGPGKVAEVVGRHVFRSIAGQNDQIVGYNLIDRHQFFGTTKHYARYDAVIYVRASVLSHILKSFQKFVNLSIVEMPSAARKAAKADCKEEDRRRPRPRPRYGLQFTETADNCTTLAIDEESSALIERFANGDEPGKDRSLAWLPHISKFYDIRQFSNFCANFKLAEYVNLGISRTAPLLLSLVHDFDRSSNSSMYIFLADMKKGREK